MQDVEAAVEKELIQQAELLLRSMGSLDCSLGNLRREVVVRVLLEAGPDDDQKLQTLRRMVVNKKTADRRLRDRRLREASKNRSEGTRRHQTDSVGREYAIGNTRRDPAGPQPLSNFTF